MTDINFGGITIPSQQTLSPATDKDIAFRPACSQLVPIEMGGNVFWTVTMSDGQRRELAVYAPMPEQEAHFWLDADGVCKIGGVDVPLVYVDQVPQRQVAQVTTTPAMGDGAAIDQAGQGIQTVTPVAPSSNTNFPPFSTVVGGLLLAIGFYFLWKSVRGGPQRPPRPTQPPSKPKGSDHAEALNDIFGGGQQ